MGLLGTLPAILLVYLWGEEGGMWAVKAELAPQDPGLHKDISELQLCVGQWAAIEGKNKRTINSNSFYCLTVES